LLVRNAGKGAGETIREEAAAIHDLATHMAELSRGLMEFSHRGTKRTAYGVNELVEKTMEFVRPQARFRSVTLSFAPGETVPSIEMDPGQIQQVLLTLLGRAAERLRDGEPQSLEIRTYGDEKRRRVGVEILASSGTPADADGDPELGTVHRILERHQGHLEMDHDADRGEIVRVLLPAA
jgi:C4-dicarboxylate-specific signal transduction histidine kinase